MDKLQLKQILVSNQKDVERYELVPRSFPLDDFPCLALVGVRRAGKSFLKLQALSEQKQLRFIYTFILVNYLTDKT